MVVSLKGAKELGVRCSCGNPGVLQTERRKFPYCQKCFEAHLVKNIRHEIGPGSVKLKPVQGYFFDAVQAACKLARKEIILDEAGATPGCAETAAAATIQYLLARQQQTVVFPKTITLQELQTFFKADQPVFLDSITQELIDIEKKYPGTINSINKH